MNVSNRRGESRPSGRLRPRRSVGTRGGCGDGRGPCACPGEWRFRQGFMLSRWSSSPGRGQAQGPIHFTLGTSRCRGQRSQRVQQRDKVEKPVLRLKRLRRGEVTLLRLVLIVDLLDLTAVDAQATLRQELAHHVLTHAPQQWLACLLWLQDQGQVQRLGQDK